jgi:hypothetical protein
MEGHRHKARCARQGLKASQVCTLVTSLPDCRESPLKGLPIEMNLTESGFNWLKGTPPAPLPARDLYSDNVTSYSNWQLEPNCQWINLKSTPNGVVNMFDGHLSVINWKSHNDCSASLKLAQRTSGRWVRILQYCLPLAIAYIIAN